MNSPVLPIVPAIVGDHVHYYEADAKGRVEQWAQLRIPPSFTVQDAVALGLNLHTSFLAITARDEPPEPEPEPEPRALPSMMRRLGPRPGSDQVYRVLADVGPATARQLCDITGTPVQVLSMRLAGLRTRGRAYFDGHKWHTNGDGPAVATTAAPRGTVAVAAATARGASSKHVAAYVVAHPGVTRTELREQLGLSGKDLYNRMWYLRAQLRVDEADRVWPVLEQ